MTKIESINTISQLNFAKQASAPQKLNNGSKKKTYAIISSLAGLAVMGAAAIYLKKTKVISYEEALRKAGVEIDGKIAKVKDSGEKYTGEIKRFVQRNKKETVKFQDGIMTEKVYHNAFGKEKCGEFYKDGAVYKISGISGNKRRKMYPVELYIDNKMIYTGDAVSENGRSVFEDAREYVNSEAFKNEIAKYKNK